MGSVLLQDQERPTESGGRLRVLMTADCVGGVWTYAMELCRGLAGAEAGGGNGRAGSGVEVVLATFGRRLSDEQRAQVGRLENVRVVESGLRCEWMQPPCADLERAAELLARLVDEHRPDVVHLNDFAAGAAPLGVPKLVVGHSCVYSWHAAVRRSAPDSQWEGYRRAVAAGLAGADLVIAPTAAMLAELRRHYGHSGPGRVIHNGRALEGPPAEERGQFILSAGRVWDEAKNVRTLAEAARGLAWPVRVAGEAAHPDGGAAWFDNVELLGPLPACDLHRLMSQAMIYALPARYEPFGLSALEAALAGCCLVLGDIATLREVWGEAAVYVPPDDAEALRGTLAGLIADEPRRRRLAGAAWRRAREYSPQRMTIEYLEEYRRLAAALHG